MFSVPAHLPATRASQLSPFQPGPFIEPPQPTVCLCSLPICWRRRRKAWLFSIIFILQPFGTRAESCQSCNALHQINIFSWNGNYTLFVCLWIHIFWSVNEALTWKSHFKSSLLVFLSKWVKGNSWQRLASLEEFKGQSGNLFRKVGIVQYL